MSTNKTTTVNKSVSHSTQDIKTNLMELYYKVVRGLNVPQLYQLLNDAVAENIEDTFILVFYIRDCRGGNGERELGRRALSWLFITYPAKFMKVAHLIPKYGRWDDLYQFFPGVLNLCNEEYICTNYSAQILDSHIKFIKECQLKIVKLVVNQLISDRQKMMEGKPCSILAKWLPTENSSMDREYHLVRTICKMMMISPRKYRKEYVSPLREYLNIVERYMCSNNWDKINFSTVPSCAMSKLKNAFKKNTPKNFAIWQSQLIKSNTSICVNTDKLFPHKLVKECLKYKSNDITEEKWKIIENQVEYYGKLDKSLVVCDVSESMSFYNSGTPLHVSIAMGVLVSHATKGVFHNHIMSFNPEPSLFVLQEGSTLLERVHKIKKYATGYSTDFVKIHRHLIVNAKLSKCSEKDMPNTIFVISDMPLESVLGRNDNYETVKKWYKLAGYEMPRMIYWNVKDSITDYSVTVNDYGTIIISGFSIIILQSIIETGEFNPYMMLRKTIDGQRYVPIRQALS